LIVLKTAERRNNIAHSLLHNDPPIRTLTYLSTVAEVNSGPLGKIWIRPADYMEAVRHTPFENRIESSVYRRQLQRDALIEAKVEKLKLFESH
jgi:hypothetical protein